VKDEVDVELSQVPWFLWDDLISMAVSSRS
jgi:hypothetical protein